MEYKRREWLDEWSGAHVMATIVDDVPDLDIFNGDTVVRLMHNAWFDESSSPIHQRNLMLIRKLLDVLTDFEAAYQAALVERPTDDAPTMTILHNE